jgi:hypothetical protein
MVAWGWRCRIVGWGWGPYRWLGMRSSIVGWEAHDCAARTLSERWEGMGLYRWLGMGGVIALRAH